MGGWTGIGKDRINWNGQIEQRELSPRKDNDLITKKYFDDNAGGGGIDADIIVVLDAEVATLDGNVLILQ